MFSNYLEIAGATYNVSYDKAVDYCSWLVGRSEDQEDVNDKELEKDKIENYDGFLQVNKYNGEDKSNRIMKEVGKFTELQYFYSDPSFIVDNIYLGSAQNAATKSILDKFEITLVMNVTKSIRNYYPDEIEYIKYDLYDNNQNSIGKHLEDAYNKIKEHQQNKEGNILIHCFMGRSRSATVVLYYLMRTRVNEDGSPYSFEDAVEFLLKQRPIVNPTFQFTKDLANSIKQIKKNTTDTEEQLSEDSYLMDNVDIESTEE